MSLSSPRGFLEGERTSTNCVVWSPRRYVAPPDLLAALARRGIVADTSDSPYTTLALVCRFPRQPARPASRLADPAAGAGVLVLLEPRRLHQLAEVVDLVGRFRPATAIWVHEESDPRRIKALSPLEVVALFTNPATIFPHHDLHPESSGLQHTPPHPATSPIPAPLSDPAPSRLKFAADTSAPNAAPAAPLRDDLVPATSSRPDRRLHTALAPQLSPRSLLTDEELAMLLAGRGLDGNQSH